MATIGYYDMSDGQGDAAQVDEIESNGHTAVNITEPNSTQLENIDTLYVQNPSNSSYGSEYLSNSSDIANAVNSGMNLIIFDRSVSNADTILPGGSEIEVRRDFSDGRNVELADGAPDGFASGTAGTLDDNTLDGGNYSTHGYVELSSLPPGAVPLLTTSDPSHVVAFTYPFGDGNVFYSSIPLDYYTGTSHAAITPSEIDVLFGNINEIMCFTAGTPILTDEGEVFVERLKPGARVKTGAGDYEELIQVYSTVINSNDLARNDKLRPVRITAGALDDGLPKRDLLLSRQHRVLVSSPISQKMFGADSILISAINLTKVSGIFVDHQISHVRYYHLVFAQHELVFANGALCESLLLTAENSEGLPKEIREEVGFLFPEIANMTRENVLPAAFIPTQRKQVKFARRYSS